MRRSILIYIYVTKGLSSSPAIFVLHVQQQSYSMGAATSELAR